MTKGELYSPATQGSEGSCAAICRVHPYTSRRPLQVKKGFTMAYSRRSNFSLPIIAPDVAGKYHRHKIGNESGNKIGNISGNRPTYAAQPTTATPLASLQSAQADFAAERNEALRRGFNRPLPTSTNTS